MVAPTLGVSGFLCKRVGRQLLLEIRSPDSMVKFPCASAVGAKPSLMAVV